MAKYTFNSYCLTVEAPESILSMHINVFLILSTTVIIKNVKQRFLYVKHRYIFNDV